MGPWHVLQQEVTIGHLAYMPVMLTFAEALEILGRALQALHVTS